MSSGRAANPVTSVLVLPVDTRPVLSAWSSDKAATTKEVEVFTISKKDTKTLKEEFWTQTVNQNHLYSDCKLQLNVVGL